MIRAAATEDGQTVYWYDMALGVYSIVYGEMDDRAPLLSARMTTAYAMPPGEMQAPEPGLQADLSALVLDANGVRQEQHGYSFAEPVPVRIGSCAYTGLPFSQTFDTDPGNVDGFMYLTELGIAYYAWNEAPGEERVDYAPTDIGAAR
ncbi:hypothetical protein [Roseisalinus antarcticus]|uniref:Uncharacterized protein n=1 Tax=Roseisalinus antarcticus TaxID=254357 RepID=A0A1Y5T1L6_9RHOB|nr:hypothetical protein [Roseisalinus antarcticus]SLN51988.1 hypothetical protein ROA7023_02287 [Roseisalinus antarcticus]